MNEKYHELLGPSFVVQEVMKLMAVMICSIFNYDSFQNSILGILHSIDIVAWTLFPYFLLPKTSFFSYLYPSS
jgi:hypothetical protein